MTACEADLGVYKDKVHVEETAHASTRDFYVARVDEEVVTGRLARLEFRGASFDTVRALTHTNGDPPDLGFSPHVDGALCADLFRGCDVVLDLANDRVAVVQRER